MSRNLPLLLAALALACLIDCGSSESSPSSDGDGGTEPPVDGGVDAREEDACTATTLDIFAYASSQDSEARAVASDDAGSLFVVGFGEDDAGVKRFMVRQSRDEGATWSLADVAQEAKGKPASAHAVATRGTVIRVVGTAETADGKHMLYGRLSRDRGATWVPGHGAIVAISTESVMTGVAEAADGGLYRPYYITMPTGPRYWRVFRAEDGFTEDDFVPTSTSIRSAVPHGIALGPAGSIHVVGSATATSGRTHWMARSSNDGIAWKVEEELAEGDASEARAVAVTTSGDLFVVGSVQGGGGRRWLVRRRLATDGSFTTVDDFQASSGRDAEALAVVALPAGRVAVVGRAQDGAGADALVARLSNDNGATWKTVDSFRPEQWQGAGGQGVAATAGGRLVLVGWARDSQGVSHWLVRGLACP